MAAPLTIKKSVLAFKQETTTGTAISVSGSDATMNVYNMSMQPSINMTRRQGQGAFGRIKGVQEAKMGTCSFDVDAIGAASAPAWVGMMNSCGWVNSTGTLSPKTLAPTDGGTVHTATLVAYEDGLKKTIHGAMGKWSIELVPGSSARWHFEFTGAWDAVADASILTPTYETAIPPRVASGTLTFGSYTPSFSRMVIDSGNVVYLRPVIGTASGIAYACISDRLPTISIDPEASTVADRDHYGIWDAGTTAALTATWGSTGNQITIAAPVCQIVNIQEGDRSGIRVENVTYECLKSANAGDDELTITYNG